MTTIEKLRLHKEIEARNEARRQQYIRECGVHSAIEISARAILDSLDILAQHYHVTRAELLELLVNTMWAVQQTDEQEGVSYGA